MAKKDFLEFHHSLLELIKTFENKKIMLKVKDDLDSNIINIFGDGADSLSLAKNGMDAVSELAYTTAEHHPYWALLYHCTQISNMSLDRWQTELTRDELDEIEWSINELKNACKKLKEDLESK